MVLGTAAAPPLTTGRTQRIQTQSWADNLVHHLHMPAALEVAGAEERMCRPTPDNRTVRVHGIAVLLDPHCRKTVQPAAGMLAPVPWAALGWLVRRLVSCDG